MSEDGHRVSPDDIGRLLESYRPYLLSIANGELPAALQGKIGASDLVQEAILRGYRFYDTYQGKSDQELAGWLRTILIHHIANTRESYERDKRDVRRENAPDSDLANPHQPTPSEEAQLRERREWLDAAMARLPEDYRKVIRLHHEERLSFAEIGRQFGRSEDAVQKLWTRALDKLGQELGLDASSLFDL